LTGPAGGDILIKMKTLSKQQAGRNFPEVADLAHEGETVMVMNGGEPWCKIVPANGKPPRRKSAAEFQARLEKLFPRPLPARAMADFIENR
jgi:antitoxin (DNA-binding transcriptional repressor) of toxin-antitoxin stability system